MSYFKRMLDLAVANLCVIEVPGFVKRES
jgi:hypothetical protein